MIKKMNTGTPKSKAARRARRPVATTEETATSTAMYALVATEFDAAYYAKQISEPKANASQLPVGQCPRCS